MSRYFVFITGASGCGKTTVVKSLEELFSADKAAVYYFDDIGVPSTDAMIREHGSGEEWQKWATHTWIEHLYNAKDKDILILEGSFRPEFALPKLQELGVKDYLVICLHADRTIREKRLIESRNQPELANQDMENFAQALKESTLRAGEVIIDSSHKSSSQVEEDISNLISASFSS